MVFNPDPQMIQGNHIYNEAFNTLSNEVGPHIKQVHEAVPNSDIGNICAPDMVWPINDDILQQVWIYLMILIPFGCFGFGIDSLYPHQFHQPLNSLTVNQMPEVIQVSGQPPASVKRGPGVLLIQQVHQDKRI